MWSAHSPTPIDDSMIYSPSVPAGVADKDRLTKLQPQVVCPAFATTLPGLIDVMPWSAHLETGGCEVLFVR